MIMNNNATPQGILFFSMTFEYLEIYMPKQLGRSPDTVKSHRDTLTVFRRFLKDESKLSIKRFTFQEMTPALIQDFILYLKKQGNSAGTCNRRLTALRSYLWFAADRDVALQSIALRLSKIPLNREGKKEKETLSPDALSCIFQQPADTKMGLRDRVIMILLYDTAIRLDELLGLSVGDIVTARENPYIRVHGKGNKERIVAITEMTAAHLLEYLRVFHPEQSDRDALLFYTVIKGQVGRMSGGNVERFISQYARKAALLCADVPTKVHPHMFRRTRATMLYQSGVELALISKILGHSQIETTRIYAVPSMEMLRQAIVSVESPAQLDEKPIWKSCSDDEMARLCGIR
jgi:site-specific recombinase XerD